MADLLLVNANIITMDEDKPRGKGVAVKEGKILAVEDADCLMQLKTERTEVINLSGKTVLPGFIDAHLHFRAFAESLVVLNLDPHKGFCSISDIKDKIREQAKKLPRGTWIRAGGYSEIYLAEKRHPNRFDLDQSAPDHPVKLTHRSGHAHVLNSKALEIAGITRETPEPDGGIIDRDLDHGDPTGIFFGLGDFLQQKVPPLDETELAKGVKIAENKLFSYGITSFQDASARNNKERWQWFEGLKGGGSLRPRVTMMLGLEGFTQLKEREFLFCTDVADLLYGGVKIVVDETTGRISPSQNELNEIVLSIQKMGQQAIIHAIEETAIKAAIDAIEYASKVCPRFDHRHRIEHCSVCPPELAEKMALHKIMVVTNPAFLYFSGDRYLQTVIPEQFQFLYPIASLKKTGLCVAAASDSPIACANPLVGIYAAVTRLDETGVVILENEVITPCDAIRMYTESAARSSFEENVKGTISPGKYADFVVLSADPLCVPECEIKNIEVEITIMNGEVVWMANG